MTGTIAYQGGELELFAVALNWKRYFATILAPHIRGRVLEVGAGLGGTTSILCTGSEWEWLCLEPDPELARALERKCASGELSANCRVRGGTLSTLGVDERFDTIIYIDVLEHIEQDAAELTLAQSRLSSGGRLIVLSPAYQWLFSPFDSAVGHFRRYCKSDLLRLTPTGLSVISLQYLDSVGLFASLANKMLLRAPVPTSRQIVVWDRFMVPLSYHLDHWFGFRFGRSVVGIWSR